MSRWRSNPAPSRVPTFLWTLAGLLLCFPSHATPANKAGLSRHYDRFLSKELARCTTCHLPSELKNPERLEDFPHNPFGRQLRSLAGATNATTKPRSIEARLELAAGEDADGDTVDNQTELLLGHNPGDAADRPPASELAKASARRDEFSQFLAQYRWKPFAPVAQPDPPRVRNARWARNPIDAFIAAEHEKRSLRPRPEASREILLRRVYLDLIGLAPTPDEQRAFLADSSPDAYEKVVDRLLQDPRHGERWGRHWMDVWRYSDWAGWTGGNQIRDSKPHIWRWRDWIVESLNADKGYDRMILEMLAADELAPEDTDALRATGFLVRNYKMLSREQWLEDTIKHTSQAFLGLTLGCAKCHDHPVDPISQAEYYQVRAIFEPHQVRTDRIPGQLDTAKDGLVRVFDTASNTPTYFFLRGDERHPDTNRLMQPGILQVLGGNWQGGKVTLPRLAAEPDCRDFVVQDTIQAGELAITDAKAALKQARSAAATNASKLVEAELTLTVAETKHAALLAVIQAETLEGSVGRATDAWRESARAAVAAQRRQAIAEGKLKIHQTALAEGEAERKFTAAQERAGANNAAKLPGDNSTANKELEKTKKDLEAAQKRSRDAAKALTEIDKPVDVRNTKYKSRSVESYPQSSTGRRLALARWIANSKNPLTARVAINHIWLRHFGHGLVETPADFGRNGRSPSHPELLDWLAAEFMDQGWSMRALHRLIVTSATYRMSSTPDPNALQLDPDNTWYWRMSSRRMEAELVRDNLLYAAGDLDLARGGPDIDHQQGLVSKRRSLYLRLAAEKEVEFLKIFDGPAVTECYLRRPTVVPQQALAMANNELTLREARRVAETLSRTAGDDRQFTDAAIRRVLARAPRREEQQLCESFLAERTRASSASRAREQLLVVLFNHNDFVTIR